MQVSALIGSLLSFVTVAAALSADVHPHTGHQPFALLLLDDFLVADAAAHPLGRSRIIPVDHFQRLHGDHLAVLQALLLLPLLCHVSCHTLRRSPTHLKAKVVRGKEVVLLDDQPFLLQLRW